jgi:cytochrome b pre-mRNA-processing protein 3
LSFLNRFFGDTRPRAELQPLYRALVAVGRDKGWYREGAVPDTLDGRFDMLAAIVALALLRLEAEGDSGKASSVLLTEIFIDDMDGTLRQIGIGDYVVGKHIGRMMGALGGRLGAFREGLAGNGLGDAVRRNVFHDDPPSEAALALVAGRLEAFGRALEQTPLADLLAGKVHGHDHP